MNTLNEPTAQTVLGERSGLKLSESGAGRSADGCVYQC